MAKHLALFRLLSLALPFFFCPASKRKTLFRHPLIPPFRVSQPKSLGLSQKPT